MFTAIQRSWRIHPLPISILRLWLGSTWIYAGWHKATDPGFLTEGANGYIGSQLARIPKSSPLNFALNKLVENEAEYNRIFGDLVAMETARRTQHELGIGEI